jgi:5-hydroxyisourate hydrolase-like protein (transthyretin family)
MRKITIIFGLLAAFSAVYSATVTGTVTDSESGDPLSGVTVYLLSGWGGSADTVATTTSGTDGSFEFTSVETGNYRIDADLEGYNMQGGGWGSRVNVTNDAETYTENIEMAAGGAEGTIGGTVADTESGDPIAGAEVTVLDMSYVDGELTYEETATTSTDEQGEFTFTDLGDGGGGMGDIYAIVVGIDTTNYVRVGESVDIEVDINDVTSVRGMMEDFLIHYTLDFSNGENFLRVEADDITRVTLYDLSGRLIINRTLAAGSHEISLQLVSPNSVLFVNLKNSRDEINRKVIIP